MTLRCQAGRVDLKINKQGLPDLPDELLLEIISHFEAVDLLEPEEISRFSDALNPPTRPHLKRRETLIALSETCRRLRRVFRAFIWERIEVRSGMTVGQPARLLEHGDVRAKRKDFSKEILRQLGVVTADPTLAQCVRIVNVQITDFALRSLFLVLGRSLSLFPNLHTVKIVQQIKRGDEISISTQKAVRRGFRKPARYPQIRSAILSAVAYPLLEVCPNLRSFKAARGFNLGYLLMSLKNVPHLQTLSAGYRIDLARAQNIAEAVPFLEEISIYIGNYDVFRLDETRTKFMTTLRSFRNLYVLIVVKSLPRFVNCPIKQVLLSIPQENLKSLKRVIIQSPNIVGQYEFTEEIINFPIIR